MRFSIRILLLFIPVSAIGVLLALLLFDRDEVEHLPTKLSKMGVYWFDYRDGFHVGLEDRLSTAEMKTVVEVIEGGGKSCDLSIVYDQVKDADLALLSGSTKIRTIYIAHTTLTDRCLEDLCKIVGLETLTIVKSPGITEAELKKIKGSHPYLKITVDGITIAAIEHNGG